MSVRYSRMADGSLAAWVSNEPSSFAEICDLVVRQLGGEIREELIGLDQSYVDVEVDGQLITLHSEASLGVGVLATTTETEATVRRVAEHVDAQRSGAEGS